MSLDVGVEFWCSHCGRKQNQKIEFTSTYVFDYVHTCGSDDADGCGERTLFDITIATHVKRFKVESAIP